MERKVQFKVHLDRVLNDKFRALIQQKYQKYEKGLLSYEVDMALRYWLSLHTEAQTDFDKGKPNPTPKVILIFNEVKEYLLKHYYYELLNGQQIPRSQLEKAIMNTRGSDERTVRKWFRIFQKMGLIKSVTSASWEIM